MRGSLLLLCALIALAVPARGQHVECLVSRNTAYQGQQILYQVIVRGSEKAEFMEGPAVPGVVLKKLQEGVTNQSQRTSIINGKVYRESTADYMFLFEVSAEEPGRYVIPGATVKVDGKELTGRPVAFTVESAAAQDHARIEFRADHERLVRGEQFRLSVDVFLKHIPTPPSNTVDPLSQHDRGMSVFNAGKAPPEVGLPWLPPPQGLGGFDARTWIAPLEARRGSGLRLKLGDRAIQGRYIGDVEDVQQPDAAGKDVGYRRYRFAATFRADIAGTFDFSPATIGGSVVDLLPGQSRFDWRDVFARSKPLKIVVEEPPVEGRPASFGGAVGHFRFTMAGTPSPTRVTVGEPVYVTLLVEGDGYLKGVEVALAEQLGEQFRVEAPTITDSLAPGAEKPPGFPDRAGHWRQWDFKVRPLAADVIELPAISFAWFDTTSRTYEIAKTEPFPLEVMGPAGGGSDERIVVATKERGGSVELVPTEALSSNVDDLNLLGNQAPRIAWLLGAVALIPLYLLVSFTVRRQRALRADPALLRRRGAKARAQARLRAIRSRVNQEPLQAVAESHAVLLGYVADILDRPEEATTSGDLMRWVDAQGEDDTTRAKLRVLSEAAETAAFGGGGPSPKDASDLVSFVTGFLASNKHRAKILRVSLLAFACLAPTLDAQDRDAFARAHAAFSKGDYVESAELFQSMLGRDYENGYVYYNMGNAWFRAKKLGQAIRAYRLAQRYLPGDANLEVNLRRALEARPRPLSPKNERELLDYVLFWRGRITLGAMITLALLAAGLACGLGILGVFLGRPVAALRWLCLLLVLAALLLGVSAVLTWRDYERADSGVVIEDGSTLRQGPGKSFDAAYQQGIDQGSELKVLTRREGWVKVRVADQYEGWLPADRVATW